MSTRWNCQNILRENIKDLPKMYILLTKVISLSIEGFGYYFFCVDFEWINKSKT